MEVNGERMPRAVFRHFGVKNEVLHVNRANRFHALGDTAQKRGNVVLSRPGGIRLRKVLGGCFHFHRSVLFHRLCASVYSTVARKATAVVSAIILDGPLLAERGRLVVTARVPAQILEEQRVGRLRNYLHPLQAAGCSGVLRQRQLPTEAV